MKIEENISLRPYHTFHTDTRARYLAIAGNVEDILKLYKEFPHIPKLILGEGSNVLFTRNFDGLIIINNIRGQAVLVENDEIVELAVSGGENWHQLVTRTVENAWYGLENLALIPGKVGTAPVQNIGAYGVEVKDVIKRCYVLDLREKRVKVFHRSECAFGYRQSLFKKPENKGRYFIFRVDFLLKKTARPNISYKALRDFLNTKNILNPTPGDVYDAVCEIRRRKLPDPSQLGNAGSFFKNPVVNLSTFQKLETAYPGIPFYKIDDNTYKIPAAWLIEQAGFKGYREGDAGVHEKQPLVLVNYGHATGMEIFRLSEKIKKEVEARFGISLEREVNIIG